MRGFDNPADKIRKRPGEQPLLVLDDSNVASTFRRSAGSLKTDNTAANDDDAGLAMERPTQIYRVFDAAKIVHPRTGSLKHLESPRLGPGRKQQPVIAERPAVAGCDGLTLRIACDDGGSGNHADVEYVSPFPHGLEVGNWHIQRCEQFLRQLRPLIWRMLFLTNHRDRPAKAGGSQRFRGTSTRLAGAGDHNFLDGWHRRFNSHGARNLPLLAEQGSASSILGKYSWQAFLDCVDIKNSPTCL